MQHWLVCENYGKSFCLYDERAAGRLKGDPARCVKHGAILNWAPHATIGKSRKEARELLERKEQK